MNKYRDYFDIDSEYFPQVNEAIINNNPDIWKKFYPHETFVKLIKDTISVISRKQCLSIWVDGAYGTGKSHAVLTLKKLLDGSEKDTHEYFEKYNTQLNNDIFNQFQQLKNSGRILTVHRYGSSSIHSDNNLVSAIQESISYALDEAGIKSGTTLKDGIIKWLSQSWAKKMFDNLILDEYVDLFRGDNVDTIIEKLNTYSGNSLQELMSKIMKVGEEKGIKVFTLDVIGLVKWIKDVIKENNFKAIVFIWDEFTEYFRNNMKNLTGFQNIAELSLSTPFYFIIVTHNITHILPDTDNDWKKILDRFIKPHCTIELPENMAFRLMGASMEKNKNSVVQEKWEKIADELYERTYDARLLVKNKANITDNELKAILPIHPYTALLLKYISSVFDSNQRSMFDFIKNDRGDEIRGFQWFIDNYGPYDENPLLTIDMLWDFFYERGKEYLSENIRSILDCYYFAPTQSLDKDSKRVLKTVLLLQAIFYKTGNQVELFAPNEKNINNAFEGSDLENNAAASITNNLVRNNILFKKNMGSGKFMYSALINAGNTDELDKEKKGQLKKVTSFLIEEGEFSDAFNSNIFNGVFSLRYDVKYVSENNFKNNINLLLAESDVNKILAIVAFAKNETESITIGKHIKDTLKNINDNIVFIDATTITLDSDSMEQYADEMANSVIYSKQDRSISNNHKEKAKEILKKWLDKIMHSEFIVYTKDKPMGERVVDYEYLQTELSIINRKIYPNGLETGNNVNDTMWQKKPLKLGVECGVKQTTSGLYRSSNQNTKLENYIGEDAWNKNNYWTDKPNLRISIIKQYVENIIEEEFKKYGRVSIAQIYDQLKQKPYGFMPCNLTAFVLGFILKEYANETFGWSDGYNSGAMSVDKLKEIIEGVLKHNINPNPRYKIVYIVAVTPEEKAFNEASSKIFKIDKRLCTSMEQTREHIRLKMKVLPFPIWCLKYIINNFDSKSDKQIISQLIDKYIGVVNSNNISAKTDNNVAFEIGKLCDENLYIVEDMSRLVSEENCYKGMDVYLHIYDKGKLTELAKEVSDNKQYINCLKKKFVDAANWLWNIETVNKRVDEVILEYQIIAASNNILSKNISFDDTIKEWCERCNYIYISYLYAQNNWGNLSDFMLLLYNMKKAEKLLDSQKQEFLEQIRKNGTAFNDFYNNQIGIFKEACISIVGQLSDDEVNEIFSKIPTGVFTYNKTNYQNTVDLTVKDFIIKQNSEKLKSFWKYKTGTENPRLWSKKYCTPILSMVEDKDFQSAKAAFDTLNKKQPNKNELEKAMDFLEHADFFDKLNSKEQRDIAFKKSIIKSYYIILDDLDEVRNYLCNVIISEPYDWLGLPEIENKLFELAQTKYKQSGYDKALQKIDEMDVSYAKQYLKNLIRENMLVGMEIIRNN